MEFYCLKAMIVDDHSTMRSILRQYLKKMGILEIVEASNGVEAIKSLHNLQNKNCTLDFIICDLHMEHMDGMEFVKKVRKSETIKNKDIPIMILTGDSEDLLREVSLQVGATKVLHKPISVEELAAEVKQVVGFCDGNNIC